jgi:hypothetical protein
MQLFQNGCSPCRGAIPQFDLEIIKVTVGMNCLGKMVALESEVVESKIKC